MLTLRTLRQIATSRTIPSFRSAPGRHQGASLVDQGRMGHHQSRAQAAETRRQWLQQQWQNRP
ncbi:MAG: hypothetical protein DCF17_22490 [Shackletoniella antarctica]|uniref:Uncharacterized protein n=1 Tax=Shackletoniella antarctica TaxID=268115 RepID=A0A2W4VK66_9CYAN|nr:MAG: hypothetical protein DCF17_22490 [Shackletoniella antarctica]